ncbi:MAG: hypothetical protein COB36_11025 [Alphaproteobacteria bacterium]|nr:MAG: hypothetical protein COB36_11025 [Alphaproteobacteria bacterium]
MNRSTEVFFGWACIAIIIATFDYCVKNANEGEKLCEETRSYRLANVLMVRKIEEQNAAQDQPEESGDHEESS